MIKISKQQVLQEELNIILRYWETSPATRCFAICNLSGSDYLKLKDKLFTNETAESLYTKVFNFPTRNSAQKST